MPPRPSNRCTRYRGWPPSSGGSAGSARTGAPGNVSAPAATGGSVRVSDLFTASEPALVASLIVGSRKKGRPVGCRKCTCAAGRNPLGGCRNAAELTRTGRLVAPGGGHNTAQPILIARNESTPAQSIEKREEEFP